MPITGRSRNIFTQARDALTNKDEKEAMESALKENGRFQYIFLKSDWGRSQGCD